MSQRFAWLAGSRWVWLAMASVSALLALLLAPAWGGSDVETVARATVTQRLQSYGLDEYGQTYNHVCIPIAPHPTPVFESRSHRPLAWYWDYLRPDERSDDESVRQVQWLDVLSASGLLERADLTLDLGRGPVAASRYRLTERGWAIAGYQKGDPCFAVGVRRYLGLKQQEPQPVMQPGAKGIYEVHASAGFAGLDAIEPWARREDAQALVPRIKRLLEGEDETVWLVRGIGGGWKVYQHSSERRVPGRASPEGAEGEPAAGSEALIADIKALLPAFHGQGDKEPSPSRCLQLPGGDSLPVDWADLPMNSRRYAIAVALEGDAERLPNIDHKTLPYIRSLVELGVLRPAGTQTIEVGWGRPRRRAEAAVYRLTPAFEDRIDATYPDCFPLGDLSVDVVDVQLARPVAPTPKFRYKAMLRFKHPPEWMTDPALMGRWPELKNVIERGRACEGELHYVAKERRFEGGGASCWWAFDSLDENN